MDKRTDDERLRMGELLLQRDRMWTRIAKERSLLSAAITRRASTVKQHEAAVEALKERVKELTHEIASIEYEAWHR